MRKALPESSNFARLGVCLKESRGTWAVTKEAMAGTAPDCWLELSLSIEAGPTPRSPEADMLTAFDIVTTDSRKSQQASESSSTGTVTSCTRLLCASCRRRHACRDRTTPWEVGASETSPRLGTRVCKGQEPPHAFGRDQRTHSVLYPHAEVVGIGRRD